MKFNKIHLTILVVCTLLLPYANLAEADVTISQKLFQQGDTFVKSTWKSRFWGDLKEGLTIEGEGEKNGIIYKYTLYFDSKSVIRIEGTVSNDLDRELDEMSGYSEDDWGIYCRTNIWTDHESCWISMYYRRSSKTPLAIGLDKNYSPARICIGTEHYPGSKIMLRVDRNPPRSTGAGCFTENISTILKEINDGEFILTRFKKRPSQTWVGSRVSLYGLSLALELAEWLFKSIKKHP